MADTGPKKSENGKITQPTKKSILDKLSTVVDPELGINIVDLGLIYDVTIDKKEPGKLQHILVKMTFTTPACPLINDMLNEIREKLDAEDLDVEIIVVFEPLWTPDMMSERAKIKMGMM